MQTYRVVTAIMENLKNFGICHNISQNFSSKPESLEFCLFIHIPNVQQKGIFSIVELNHFNKSSLSQISLKVYSQYLAVKDMRGT